MRVTLAVYAPRPLHWCVAVDLHGYTYTADDSELDRVAPDGAVRNTADDLVRKGHDAMTPEPRPDQPVGDIVAHNFRAASVLTRHGIDFCCGGHHTLAEACASAHRDVAEVIRELEQSTSGSAVGEDVTAWPGTSLIDWIVTRHHRYVRAEIPAITALLDTTAARHGASHPELSEIRGRFRVVADDLLRHIVKEERLLFPKIACLESPPRGAAREARIDLEHSLAAMRAEHEDARLQFRHIRRLTNGYAAPPDACGTWQAAYAQLEAFEADLHRHLHLEDAVLFPLAVRLAACRCASATNSTE